MQKNINSGQLNVDLQKAIAQQGTSAEKLSLGTGCECRFALCQKQKNLDMNWWCQFITGVKEQLEVWAGVGSDGTWGVWQLSAVTFQSWLEFPGPWAWLQSHHIAGISLAVQSSLFCLFSFGQEEPLDESSVKKMILTFEKRSYKNQELRIKFPDNPEK